LKTEKKLHFVLTAAIVTVTVTTGLVVTNRLHTGIGRGCMVGCMLLAVGVICFGYYRLKLISYITSIAEKLKTDNSFRMNSDMYETEDSDKLAAAGSFFARHLLTGTGHLTKMIENRLDDNADYVAQLHEQIQDLQVQVKLLQNQKINTEAIIYSIRDAVIVVDEFEKLLLANEAAEKLFGFDFKDSRYSKIGELIKNDEKEFEEFLRKSVRSKMGAKRRQITFLRNEELKTFDCIVSCLCDRRDCGYRIVAVLHDITREKQISQMKSDFVSYVSHELKTPLASIAAYSEMLVDGEANDEKTREEFYSVIQTQAGRLNRLIEDILNISRIESGLIKVKKEPLSLTILIDQQLQMIKSCADEKNITITRQKPIVFDQVYADRDMLCRVIINLLSNAVKYTPSDGSIRIETEVDEAANIARLSITDTGFGIAEDEIEHVFDKFYRVKANKTKAKGTGLGLNLVKEIVEKVHDGRVFVKSTVGQGSTFGFELPLATRETVQSG